MLKDITNINALTIKIVDVNIYTNTMHRNRNNESFEKQNYDQSHQYNQ